VSEAKKLGIPVIAMVDTNSDPTSVEFPIPANDDAYKSIAVITYAVGQAIEEALQERKRDKEDDTTEEIMVAAELPATMEATPEAEAVPETVQGTILGGTIQQKSRRELAAEAALRRMVQNN
jgi:small subunit ribosomal protein S2